MTKIAIGCLIQWYEYEIVDEYLQTLKLALDEYEGEVLLDFHITTNEDLERSTDLSFPGRAAEAMLQDIVRLFGNHSLTYDVSSRLVTIADYRREFNSKFCERAEVLVWGETDMLVPRQTFNIIDMVHGQVTDNTPKYLLTFGINKMWDPSWEPVEHPKFTVKQHSDNPEDWWSVRHVTTVDEMREINKEVEDLDVVTISPFKFNGCGLVISSEVVRAGANIPRSVFFVHEDTAFMNVLIKMFGSIPQYHIRNVYLPHNRKHPNKRTHIAGEEEMDKNDIGKLRKSHPWYVKANKFSEENCYNLFNPSYKSKTWEDVFDD